MFFTLLPLAWIKFFSLYPYLYDMAIYMPRKLGPDRNLPSRETKKGSWLAVGLFLVGKIVGAEEEMLK